MSDIKAAPSADSCDGTGLSRYSHMREAIHAASIAPKLWDADSILGTK